MEILRIIVNWKTLLAGGAAVSFVVLASKVDPMDAGKTLETGYGAVSGIVGGVSGMKKR